MNHYCWDKMMIAKIEEDKFKLVGWANGSGCG